MITVKIEEESEQEMNRKVNIYFTMYPEKGYMTHVKNSYYDPRISMYITEIARLGSCD